MLDQIQQLVEGVERVSDSIAHDLRTPLARLRHRLERLAACSDGGAELTACVHEVDELLATFSALLKIAELEAGASLTGGTVEDVYAIAESIVELFEPAATARGITIDLSGTRATAACEARLMTQALSNLLDNAVKFSPDNTTIRVHVGSDGRLVRISVSDQGPGIDADDLPHVAERFFRADCSRATAGTGLGLSLVQAICRYHRASFDLTNLDPGLRVEIGLPAAATLDAAA